MAIRLPRSRSPLLDAKNNAPSAPELRSPAERSIHLFVSSAVESKKLFRRFRGGLGDFLKWHATRGRDRLCHNACVRRLASFPAKRNRREIWTIRFDHEFPKRYLGGNLADAGPVLKRDDAGKGNQMIQVEHFIRLFERATEAMEHAT